MSLEAYCAACTYLSENIDTYGKYYCERKGEDHFACDPKCYNFCEAYRRSNSARENMYSNSQSHQGSGCYLTTAMCNILNYPDDNYYLQTLRTFRDTKLKQDYKYLPLLLTYDIIGPLIKKNMEEDKERLTIAKTLFKNYIEKAVLAIENDKENEAINIYIAMTNSLAKRYNINTHILQVDPEFIKQSNIDINSLGHGRARIKRLEKETF